MRTKIRVYATSLQFHDAGEQAKGLPTKAYTAMKGDHHRDSLRPLTDSSYRPKNSDMRSNPFETFETLSRWTYADR